MIKIKILSKDELNVLKTKQLLSRLNKLHKCESCYASSYDAPYIQNPDEIETNYIHYKETEKWEIAYTELKEILSERENIIKGHELINLKKEKIKNTNKKNKEKPKFINK